MADDDTGPSDAANAPAAAVGGASSFGGLTWPPDHWPAMLGGSGLPPVPPPPGGAPEDSMLPQGDIQRKPDDASTPANATPAQAVPAPDAVSAADNAPGVAGTLEASGAGAVQLGAPGVAPAADVTSGTAVQVGPDGKPIEPSQAPSFDELKARAAKEAEEDAAKEAYYRDHPEALVEDTIKANRAAMQEWYAKQEKAAAADREVAAANLATMQKRYDESFAATAQMKQDADRLMNTKIDGTLGGLGTGKAILGGLMAGLGGALQSANGGRNLGLEAVDKAIQRNIDVQKDNIANGWKGLGVKQSIIGEELARHGDLYRAQEAYRVGAYQSVMGQLDREAQNYDPRGTTVRAIASAKQDLAARVQQAQQTYQQQHFKNSVDYMKAVGDIQKPVIEAQSKQAEIDAANARTRMEVGLGYSRIASEERRAADEHKDKEADRQQARELAQGKDWEERGIGDPATGEPMVTAQGAPMLAKARELDAKGQQQAAADLRKQAAQQYGIRMANAEDAGKVQQTIAFAQSMADKIAKMKAQLDADPSITNRAAYAQLATEFESIKVDNIKAYGMNASSREMEAFKDQFGDSPEELSTRLRATGGEAKLRARLDAVQAGLQGDVDALMKAKKVKGGWTPTPLTTYKPQPTPADELQTSALKSGGGPGTLIFSDERTAAIDQLLRQATAASTPEQQQQYLQALDAIARDGVTDADMERAAAAATKLRGGKGASGGGGKGVPVGTLGSWMD